MMIEWALIAGFDWSNGNAQKIADRHGVGQREAEEVFMNTPLLMVEDVLHSRAETRFNALGRTDEGRILHLTFTLRQQNTLIRVISARGASRKERAVYEKAP